MKIRIFLISLLIVAYTTIDITAQDFKVTQIEPAYGTPGSSFTIIGTGFNSSTSDNTVTFLPVGGGTGTEATITSAGSNRLAVTVPSGISGGNYNLEIFRDNYIDNTTTTSTDVFGVINSGGYLGENGSNKKTPLSGGNYSSLQAIDFNLDGHLDFVYVNLSSNKVMWAESDGSSTPSFTEHEIASFTRPSIVKAADIDLDGDMDMVVTQNNSNYHPIVDYKLFWYENDGATTPSFTQHEVADFSDSPNSLNYISKFELADLDGDGDKDIVLTLNEDKEVVWYRNNSVYSSHFGPKQLLKSFPTNAPRRLSVGDINNDGKIDIVLATLTELGWLKNNSGSFQYSVINDNEVYNSFSLHLSDIDNDGDLDIFTQASSNNIYRLENDGASNPTFTISSIGSGSVFLIASGDINNDGDTDILYRGYGSDVLILDNDGSASPSFSQLTAKEGGDQPKSLLLGDVDNDGGLDIIAPTYSSLDYYKNIDRPNVLGQSVLFDGDGDYIEIADDNALDLNNQFTIEAWIKPASLDSDFQRFLSKTNAYGIGISNSTIRFTTYGVRDYDLSYNTLTDDTWVHIATVMDASNTVTFYVNGQDVGAISTGAGGANTSTSSLYIGSNSNGSEAFDGKIDELRIWNENRTQEEIQTNMYQSLVGGESDLLAYYSFDGDGASATDFTSNTFDGTFNDDVTRDTETHPYGTIITGNEGWRMMSTPVNGINYGELLDTLWTQGFTGADYTEDNSNVLVWDETTQSFNSISNATDIPESGQGFITYVYNDDNFDGTGDGFPKHIVTDNTQRIGEVSPTLSFTDSGTLADDGWNLVGNPYGATIDWDAASGLSSSNLDASFYVWSDSANAGAGDYLSWNGTTGTLSSGKIAPWQGFWVKANAAAPSLSLTDDARSSGGVFRKQAPVSELKFNLSGETLSSRTILMFSEQALIEKDGLDAYKLSSLNKEYLSLFTQLENGSALDINALPKQLEKSLNVPLDIRGSDLNGKFELSWNSSSLPEAWNLTLIDNHAGKEVNLRDTQQYHFDLETASKVVQSESEETPQSLNTPVHGVLSPTIIKAKANSSSRFTLRIAPSGVNVSNEPATELPTVVELDQNYPNPFNPSTSIAFGLPQSGKVTLEVFDLLGRKVATLLNGENRSAGRYTINFDASSLSSGMYIYRLQTGSSIITKKLTLIK